MANHKAAAPQCPIHQRVLICPACIGAKGGKVTSPRKARASRRVGKLGGRPPKGSATR